MNNTKSTPKKAGLFKRLVKGMKAGDRVICVDDTGWLVPDPGYEHLAPKKGSEYTIMEYKKFGGVAAISLVGGNKDDFYRAVRFKRVST